MQEKIIEKKWKGIYNISLGWVFVSLFLFLLCYLFTIYGITEKMADGSRSALLLASCFFSIGNFLLIGFLCLKIRKKFILFSNNTLNYLDGMIQGKKPEFSELEKETLTGKIQYKMQYLYNMSAGLIEKGEKEKQKLQQLVSDISHQLKTPLANISLYSDTLLEREVPKEKQHEFLLRMHNQIETLDFLIQTLIKMSRLETDMIQLKKVKKPLIQTILNALNSVINQAEEKNIKISMQCEQDLVAVHDTKWTAEAIFNVLDNAVKYTPVNGKISIHVHSLELYTRIDISDTGIGIQKSSVNHIFQRFYRDDKTKHFSGMGIGLYLTREILSRENGYIKVKSEPGEGSTFSIYLSKEDVDS